jgi:hypothetical protein
MSSANPNQASEFLRGLIQDEGEKVLFNFGQTAVQSQGNILESVNSSVADELEARVKLVKEGTPPHAAYLINQLPYVHGIVGAVIDAREATTLSELASFALSADFKLGGSE